MKPTEMVDLHCHILPGIDDGARDLADSIAMARQAEADGIAAVCATPHIRHDHDVRIGELPERLDQLRQAVTEAGCRTDILPGGEVAVTAVDGLDYDELASVSLGGSARWILLEPAPGPLDDSLDGALKRLHGRGFRVLIAHPERHLAGDLSQRLKRLVKAGALVQVTAAFLVDQRTRDGMLELARARLIHLLGSDAHSSRAGRPVAISNGLEVLRSIDALAPHVDWIGRIAPHAIVRGDDVTPPF